MLADMDLARQSTSLSLLSRQVSAMVSMPRMPLMGGADVWDLRWPHARFAWLALALLAGLLQFFPSMRR